jgi:hypothetical protein
VGLIGGDPRCARFFLFSRSPIYFRLLKVQLCRCRLPAADVLDPGRSCFTLKLRACFPSIKIHIIEGMAIPAGACTLCRNVLSSTLRTQPQSTKLKNPATVSYAQWKIKTSPLEQLEDQGEESGACRIDHSEMCPFWFGDASAKQKNCATFHETWLVTLRQKLQNVVRWHLRFVPNRSAQVGKPRPPQIDRHLYCLHLEEGTFGWRC